MVVVDGKLVEHLHVVEARRQVPRRGDRRNAALRRSAHASSRRAISPRARRCAIDLEQRHAVELRTRAVLAHRQAVDQDAADREHGCCSASRNDARTFLSSQRRHVEQQLLGVDAFRIEQDQIDAEAIQLVARPVVEQEQRPATLVGVLQLVELDQELGFGGHQRLCDHEQAEGGADRAELVAGRRCEGFRSFRWSASLAVFISLDVGRAG